MHKEDNVKHILNDENKDYYKISEEDWQTIKDLVEGFGNVINLDLNPIRKRDGKAPLEPRLIKTHLVFLFTELFNLE